MATLHIEGRKGLRDHVLSKARSFRKEIVEIDGAQFEVRQPTLGVRGEIIKHGKVTSDKVEDIDSVALLLAATIFCTYVPGTDERVFELADKDTLMGTPAGDWVDTLGKRAIALMNTVATEQAKN